MPTTTIIRLASSKTRRANQARQAYTADIYVALENRIDVRYIRATYRMMLNTQRVVHEPQPTRSALVSAMAIGNRCNVKRVHT